MSAKPAAGAASQNNNERYAGTDWDTNQVIEANALKCKADTAVAQPVCRDLSGNKSAHRQLCPADAVNCRLKGTEAATRRCLR